MPLQLTKNRTTGAIKWDHTCEVCGGHAVLATGCFPGEGMALLTPINLPLTRVKQSIQARIDSTPDQLAIDRQETRQAAQAITARTATQAADKAEDTVQGFLSQLRRALPFIEDNATNAQGRKMLVDILMQHTKQAEGEATQ